MSDMAFSMRGHDPSKSQLDIDLQIIDFGKPERTPVKLAASVFEDRLPMLPRSVTFISQKIVLRKLPVIHLHDPVPGNLRYDGCRGHRDAPSIAANDRFLWDGNRYPIQTVDEEIIGRGERLRTASFMAASVACRMFTASITGASTTPIPIATASRSITS